RRRSQPARREQEEVGGGLSGCDLDGTEDMRLEKAQQPGHRQPLADPLEMAVRGDAAQQGQGVEQLLDAGDRLQLALQDQSRAGPHGLKELVRQRTPEAALDGGTEGRTVLAEAKCQGLLGRPRQVPPDKAPSKPPGKNQFAVGQHTITIKDHEIGHAAPFTLGLVCCVYGLEYSDLSPLERSCAMPRFCANLGFLFGEVPFLDRFEAAARAGFTGVEYASPYDHPAPELRARLKAAGLTQVLINSPAGNRAAGERGMACLPGRVAAFRDGVAQALDYAVALDCKLVHVMAGVPPQDVAWDTAAALYAANLALAAEKALAAGVRLVIEPLNPRDAPGYLLRTQEQGAAIVAAIGRDRLGLQFDIYHCQTAQGDVTRRLEALMPVIDPMQLADVPGRHEPGTGEIGWDYVFRRIDELGYAGWIGCEYNPIGDTVAGLAWRQRYGVR